MSKIWKVERAEKQADALAKALNISPLLAHLLVKRGVTSENETKNFLNPRLVHLRPPDTMTGTVQAAETIKEAIRTGKKICVYGDFDVDGLTSTALLYEIITTLGGTVFPFIPDRRRHGYGLNVEIVEELGRKNYDLLITVDNGISNRKEVEAATDLGISVIITDHHLPPPDDLPQATAIVNPKQPGCQYPFKELAGVGIAFKLAQVLCSLSHREELVWDKLDLAALGTIADIAPLIDENRVLAVEGLKVINENPRPGISALLAASGIKGEISSEQVSFILAPRLNAAGRMFSARDGFDLLVCDDPEKCGVLAAKLERYNRQRQRIEEKVLREALARIETERLHEAPSIVAASENWHDGVKGIVAARIVERFYRPAILFSEQDGVLKGSARSIPPLDVTEAISRCGDLTLAFGGHRAAAGLRVAKGDLDRFRERFNDVCAEMLMGTDLTETLKIDTELDIGDINDGLLDEIDKLAPFGAGNPVPKFLTRGLYLDGQSRMGEGKYIKFLAQNNGHALEVVGFRQDNIDEIFNHRYQADLVYQVGRRRFNDDDFLQLKLVDIKLLNGESDVAVDHGVIELIQSILPGEPPGKSPQELFLNHVSHTDLSHARFIDRRGFDNDDYLAKIISRGQKSLIYVRDPESAHRLAAELLKERSGSSAAPFYNELGESAKRKLIGAIENGDLPALVIAGNPRIDFNRFDIHHLLLKHPTFSAASLLGLMGKISKTGRSLFIHLLYGQKEMVENKMIVEQFCPGRQELIRAYRALAMSPFSNEPDLNQTSLRILKELGLVTLAKKGYQVRDYKGKVELESSPTFKLGRLQRADFDRWADIALTLPPAKMIKTLSSL